MRISVVFILALLLFTNCLSFSQKCLTDRKDRLTNSAFTKDSLFELVKIDLDFLHLNKGETVADVGSYDGFFPCLYSAFCDSIIFYLNGIDEKYLAEYDTICSLCKQVSRKRFTNGFHIALGNDTSTNLPSHLFDKVVIRDALHHFNSQNKMLQDVRRILKPQGNLFLYEPIRDNETKTFGLCKGALSYADLLSLLSQNGFELVRAQEIASPLKLHWFELKLKDN